ncbi:glycosyltransferase family 9 protein [Rubrivivax gelatinosus]|uniref:glycosyltransferase family 9 protein n=1 Tax=Rubrivivax gelatinosus TaxID=28068 RepID=UPI00190444BB
MPHGRHSAGARAQPRESLCLAERLDSRTRPRGRHHAPRGAPPARPGGRRRLAHRRRAAALRAAPGRPGARGRSPGRRRRRAGAARRRRYALLHPGASAASRRWPAERFAGVGRALAAAGLAVLVAGDGADEPLCAAVLAGMRGAGRTIGPTTLGELAALIAGAELLVGNNSGPVHLAAAVGTPVLVLYAQTNPQHTPWRVPARVLSHAVACRWCLKSRCPQVHHGCLLGVGVDEAAEAALALASAQRTMKMEQDA